MPWNPTADCSHPTGQFRSLKLSVILAAVSLLTAVTWTSSSPGADLPWIAGDGNWQDGANWGLVIEPGFPISFYSGPPRDTDTATISNAGSNSIDLTGNTAPINGLIVQNANRLSTNGHRLRVDDGGAALSHISGVGSSLSVHEGGTLGPIIGLPGNPLLPTIGNIGFHSDRLLIEQRGVVNLFPGSTMLIDEVATIAKDSSLQGSGVARLGNLTTPIGTQVLNNAGSIRVATFGPFGGGDGELRLQALGGGRLDLDGNTADGVLDVDGGFNGSVNRLSLVVDGKLSDAFGGTLLIGAADRAHFTQPWEMSGGTLEMRGIDAPAKLQGALLTASTSEIAVLAGNGVIENDLLMESGNIDVHENATLTLAGATDLSSGATLNLAAPLTNLIVDATTKINTSIFNWDGLENSKTIVNAGGSLNIQADHLEPKTLTFLPIIRDFQLLPAPSKFDGKLEIAGSADVRLSGADRWWINNGNTSMQGGRLTGTPLTNLRTVTGHGKVATDRFNNGGVVQANGGVLELASAAGVDLDGSSTYDGTNEGDGEAQALEGSILISGPMPSSFHGTLRIGNGHRFTYDTGSPSDRFRIANATEDSDSGDDFGSLYLDGGFLFVDEFEQASTLKTQGAGSAIFAKQIDFQKTSTNTLGSDLELHGDTTIRAGAKFTGTGRLINTKIGTMQTRDGAEVDAVLQNRGSLQIGNSPGRLDVADYDQTATGNLEMELQGTAIGDYDRLLVSGMANLDGSLELSLLGGEEPIPYESTTLINAASGIDGTFSSVAGVNYRPGYGLAVTYDAFNVQVTPALVGDANLDQQVAFADFLELSGNFGNKGTWGNGDFDGDGSIAFGDFLMLSDNFGTEIAAVSGHRLQAVPEPRTATLLLLAFAGLAQYRRQSSNSPRQK